MNVKKEELLQSMAFDINKQVQKLQQQQRKEVENMLQSSIIYCRKKKKENKIKLFKQ